MRFGMFFELQMPKPWSDTAEYDTLWQAVEQVTYAEEMGFEQVWLVKGSEPSRDARCRPPKTHRHVLHSPAACKT